ncbi:MAG: discoidin domain-containing protein, partial [Acidimicrobiia bacterium]
DGDPATAWTNHFGDQLGSWLELDLDEPRTLDRLDLAVGADGDHSVPTQLRIVADGVTEQTVVVPPIADGEGVVVVPIRLEPIRGRSFRVVVDGVRPVTTVDWFGGGPIDMPVSIAELGIGTSRPGLTGTSTAGPVVDTCRDDLLTIDGRRVWVRIVGPTAAASGPTGLDVAACGPDAAGIALGAGRHELRAVPGTRSGFDLDRIVLASSPGGAAAQPPAAPPTGPTASADHGVEVRDEGRTSFDLRVTGGAGPVWLVLGQSWSTGWEASADGRDLGRPVLVDGYANGWLVDPGADGVVDVELRWTPQRLVTAGLWSSAAGVLLCILIVLLPGRRRRPAGAPAPGPRLRPLLVRNRRRPSWPATLVAAGAVGAGAGLTIHPAVGLGVTVVAVAALRLSYGRLVAALGAVGGVAAAAAFTAGRQLRNDYPADFGWTDFFRPAHLLAAGGLALLALVLVVDRLRADPAPPEGTLTLGGVPAREPTPATGGSVAGGSAAG